MAKNVKTLVITGFGVNCERETSCAFTVAGSAVEQIHLNDILDGGRSLADFHILAFIGGFSFGDHIGAGTVFSNRVKYRMRDQLEKFVADGKLVIGICNGFQTMTRLGLVPAVDGAYFTQQVALAHNMQGTFRDDWIVVKENPKCPCVFTKGIGTIPLPIRHGEGRLVAENDAMLKKLEKNNLVALRYADPVTGEATMEFPHNPNGSTNAIAGICDPSGRMFGLMPHPEAYLSPYNHPDWTRQKLEGTLPEKGLGQKIFENAVGFARKNL
jgi:phosphoribosylformylglycinamidine synthase